MDSGGQRGGTGVAFPERAARAAGAAEAHESKAVRDFSDLSLAGKFRDDASGKSA